MAVPESGAVSCVSRAISSTGIVLWTLMNDIRTRQTVGSLRPRLPCGGQMSHVYISENRFHKIILVYPHIHSSSDEQGHDAVERRPDRGGLYPGLAAIKRTRVLEDVGQEVKIAPRLPKIGRRESRHAVRPDDEIGRAHV